MSASPLEMLRSRLKFSIARKPVRLIGIVLASFTVTFGLFQFIPGTANGDGTSWSNTPIELTNFPGNSPTNDGAYGGDAYLKSISCASPGNCSAGGYYYADGSQAFVVNEINYTWQTPQEITDSDSTNLGSERSNGQAYIVSVSCAPDGSCSAGGYFRDSSDYQQAFVVNGTTSSAWGDAQTITNGRPGQPGGRSCGSGRVSFVRGG